MTSSPCGRAACRRPLAESPPVMPICILLAVSNGRGRTWLPAAEAPLIRLQSLESALRNAHKQMKKMLQTDHIASKAHRCATTHHYSLLLKHSLGPLWRFQRHMSHTALPPSLPASASRIFAKPLGRIVIVPSVAHGGQQCNTPSKGAEGPEVQANSSEVLHQ